MARIKLHTSLADGTMKQTIICESIREMKDICAMNDMTPPRKHSNGVYFATQKESYGRMSIEDIKAIIGMA